MAKKYNNNNNNNGNNNNRNYNNNGNNDNGPKRTWAVYTKLKDGGGAFIVNAFRITEQGLIKYTVKPYEKTWKEKGVPGIVKGKTTGNEFHKMICVIDYPQGASEIVPCLFALKTQKITLQNKGLVITPNGRGQLASGKRVTGAVVKFYN